VSEQKLSATKDGRMTERERDELRRVAAGVALDQIGKEEFFRRVNAAGRLVYETLVSHFGDDPLGMAIGLTALDHVTESTMQQVQEMILATMTAAPEGWEN